MTIYAQFATYVYQINFVFSTIETIAAAHNRRLCVRDPMHRLQLKLMRAEACLTDGVGAYPRSR